MVPERAQPDIGLPNNAEDQMDLLLNDLPEQYELLAKVNQGAMGAIYKARNRYTGANYGIKVIRPEMNFVQDSVQRFMLEAKATTLLKHPNICQVHDFGLTKSKMPYLVMEWINGRSLDKKIENDQRVSIAEIVPIFQQIATALAHAHRNQVVHRDLKPENVMLSHNAAGRDEVHIVDFGIAKVLSEEDNPKQSQGLTTTGMIIGTPLYISPEQINSKTVDGRTDIYSLGCVMYFALSGKPPFVGDSAMDTFTMHLNSEPPEIDPARKIPSSLKHIMLKAMQKDPADRYQTMEQLAQDLAKFNQGIKFKHNTLASERKSISRKLVTLVCFILGFLIMYAISIGLQNFLDSTSSHEGTKSQTVKEHNKTSSPKVKLKSSQ